MLLNAHQLYSTPPPTLLKFSQSIYSGDVNLGNPRLVALITLLLVVTVFGYLQRYVISSRLFGVTE